MSLNFKIEKFPKSNNYLFGLTVAGILGIFILSRILILMAPISFSDVPYYANIGYQAYLGNKQGLTLYELRIFEYPPLSAVLFSIPNIFINADLLSFKSYTSQYIIYYRAIMLLFDCLIFMVLFFITVHFYGRSKFKILVTSLIYIIGTLLLFNLAFDRLDMVLLFFLVTTFYFQIKGKYILSAIFITIGIFFKMIPLLLVPLWLLAWASKINIAEKSFWRYENLKLAFKAFTALIASNLLFLGGFLWLYGPKIVDFLSYHGNRGIQVESLYSTFIQILHWFGLSYAIETSYGSQNIVSSISPVLSKLSPFLIIAGIAIIIFKISKQQKENDIKNFSFAVQKPAILGKGYLLVILAILIFSKVLSTQYFLLPIPFIALFLGNKPYGFSLLWFFLLLLTTLIFPYLYQSDIISLGSSGFGKPTLMGTTLLLSRNVLLVYFFFQFYKNLNLKPVEKNIFFSKKYSHNNFYPLMLIVGISTLLLVVNLVSSMY